MARLGRTLEEYTANGGWSSHYFAENAVRLMGELKDLGVDVVIGRTVIHLTKGDVKLKAYVHHNGRSEEYATITKFNGEELLTAHYTDFKKLGDFVKHQFT